MNDYLHSSYKLLCSIPLHNLADFVVRKINDGIFKEFLAYLMKKYKYIQGFGQGQKYCSDPDVLKVIKIAMNRNWSNQKANPTLKTKMGNK